MVAALGGMVEAFPGKAEGNRRILESIGAAPVASDEAWAALTLGVSVLNAMLLIFLGLAVVLGSRRRSAPLWVIATGLFLAAAVFLDNARCAGDLGVGGVSVLFHTWWPVGWFPAVLLPLAWQGAMLWHAGFRGSGGSEMRRFRRRHLAALLANVLLAAGGCGILAVAAVTDLSRLIAFETYSVAGVPVLAWGYLAFLLVATIDPILALARAQGADEPWRQVARRRARPWLSAASLLVLLAGLAIGYVMLPVLGVFGRWGIPSDYDAVVRFCAWCDLAITLLVGAVVILLGLAVVAYEVFAGWTLPRRGLRRHAWNALVFSLAHAIVVPWASARWQGPVSGALLGAVVGVVLYSLLAWSFHTDYERWMRRLRPLVAERRTFDDLREGAERPLTPLRGLCDDLLEAERIALMPVGPFSALLGGALTHPAGSAPPPSESLARAEARAESSHEPELWSPESTGGYVWSVSLWGERGLSGILFLGPKRHGGLYAQEEIEAARLLAERTLDAEASFRLAGRLMELSRSRLAESQILDRRLRREIHDEILPRLHAAMLGLPREGESAAGTVAELSDVHRRLSALLREIPSGTLEVERWGLFFALRREVTNSLAGAFDEVVWEVADGCEGAAAQLSPIQQEVLFHAAREAIRNAAAHARGEDPSRRVRLTVAGRAEGGFTLTIADDGVGPTGASPAPGSGGRGLALHGAMMAVLGGELSVEAPESGGTQVTLRLPAGQRG